MVEKNENSSKVFHNTDKKSDTRSWTDSVFLLGFIISCALFGWELYDLFLTQTQIANKNNPYFFNTLLLLYVHISTLFYFAFHLSQNSYISNKWIFIWSTVFKDILIAFLHQLTIFKIQNSTAGIEEIISFVIYIIYFLFLIVMLVRDKNKIAIGFKSALTSLIFQSFSIMVLPFSLLKSGYDLNGVPVSQLKFADVSLSLAMFSITFVATLISYIIYKVIYLKKLTTYSITETKTKWIWISFVLILFFYMSLVWGNNQKWSINIFVIADIIVGVIPLISIIVLILFPNRVNINKNHYSMFVWIMFLIKIGLHAFHIWNQGDSLVIPGKDFLFSSCAFLLFAILSTLTYYGSDDTGKIRLFIEWISFIITLIFIYVIFFIFLFYSFGWNTIISKKFMSIELIVMLSCATICMTHILVETNLSIESGG